MKSGSLIRIFLAALASAALLAYFGRAADHPKIEDLSMIDQEEGALVHGGANVCQLVKNNSFNCGTAYCSGIGTVQCGTINVLDTAPPTTMRKLTTKTFYTCQVCQSGSFVDCGNSGQWWWAEVVGTCDGT
jgi:hypothetical protein